MTGQQLFERFANIRYTNGHTVHRAQWHDQDELTRQAWDTLAEDLKVTFFLEPKYIQTLRNEDSEKRRQWLQGDWNLPEADPAALLPTG